MNRDLLEDITISKKKNEMSFTKKREFRTELEDALKEEGLTENTEKYIFTCASLGSGVSFFNWIRNMDEVQISELYTQLISTKGFLANAGMNSARFLLTLIISAMVDDKKFYYITADAIKRVPGLLLTKDGKISANTNKIVIYNFIDYARTYRKWVALKELDLTETEKREFLSIIKKALDEYKPKNEDQQYAYKSLSDWLKNEVRDLEVSSDTANNENNFSEAVTDTAEKQSLQTNNPEAQGESDSQQSPENKGDSSETITEKKGSASKKLMGLALYMEAIEAENDKVKKELATSKHERGNLQRLYDRARQNIQEKEDIIAGLEHTISEAQKQIDEKEKKIEELEISIQKQSDVYTIYSTDTESRHAEKMNALAAKLKGEYIDFLESKTMDMTIDLGLNLRDQLEDVFNILIKNGINIKGR